MFFALTTLSLALSTIATPLHQRADFTLKNGKDAIALNNQFKTLSPDSPCNSGDNACVNQQFAQCVGSKFVLQACAPGTICAALPLVNSLGTSITCTTQSDLEARIQATGATDDSDTSNSSSATSTTSGVKTATAMTTVATAASSKASAGAGGNSDDPQTSLTLDPRVIASGFTNNGQDVPAAGQIPSLTSKNNFINFCLTVPHLAITNGQQNTNGSCNPAPIGVIPDVDHMPSAKFVSPKNTDTIVANQNFTIKMVMKNFSPGNFVNAKENYFAAPQTVDQSGNIIGKVSNIVINLPLILDLPPFSHTHHVIEALDSLDSTTPTNPKEFVFFQGVDSGFDAHGFLTSTVTGGVPAGFYRLCSINSSANHQPVIVAIAQHGALDDCVYFTAK